MRYTITGRNIEITDGLKKAVEEKLHKLGKYFTEDTEAKITLSVQKEAHKIEVTIPTKQGLIRAEEVSEDMYVSIDKVEDIIERQIKKFKNTVIHQQCVKFVMLFSFLRLLPFMATCPDWKKMDSFSATQVNLVQLN